MELKEIERCSKCRQFERLYTKTKVDTKIKLCVTKYGICNKKNKTVRSTYICTEYSEKENKCLNTYI